MAPGHLVDCAKNGEAWPNEGCSGGFPSWAFNYLISTGEGLVEEENYPYEAKDHDCGVDTANTETFGKVNFYVKVDDDVAHHKAALSKHTLSSGVDASTMHAYVSGTIMKEDCGHAMNHIITLIGYGTDENGIDYWLGANSWGTRWGDAGTFKISQEAGKDCGIINLSGYPILSDDQ